MKASFPRSALRDRPRFYSTYIDACPDVDLIDLLAEPLDAALDWRAFATIAHRAYGPGKWTVSVLVQHLIDTERIFSYRLLRIARGDGTPLPGFDENAFAAAATDRPLDELRAELTSVRASTLALVRSCAAEWLHRRGECSGVAISAGALGFAIAGHQRHHLAVLESRYRPLIGG